MYTKLLLLTAVVAFFAPTVNGDDYAYDDDTVVKDTTFSGLLTPIKSSDDNDIFIVEGTEDDCNAVAAALNDVSYFTKVVDSGQYASIAVREDYDRVNPIVCINDYAATAIALRKLKVYAWAHACDEVAAELNNVMNKTYGSKFKRTTSWDGTIANTMSIACVPYMESPADHRLAGSHDDANTLNAFLFEKANSKANLTNVAADVAEMKTSVATTTTDIAEMKASIADTTTNLAEVKNGVANTTTDIAIIKTSVVNTATDLAEMRANAATTAEVAGLKADVAELKALLTPECTANRLARAQGLENVPGAGYANIPGKKVSAAAIAVPTVLVLLIAAVGVTVAVMKSRGNGSGAHLRLPENNLPVIQNAAYEPPPAQDALVNDETQA